MKNDKYEIDPISKTVKRFYVKKFKFDGKRPFEIEANIYNKDVSLLSIPFLFKFK